MGRKAQHNTCVVAAQQAVQYKLIQEQFAASWQQHRLQALHLIKHSAAVLLVVAKPCYSFLNLHIKPCCSCPMIVTIWLCSSNSFHPPLPPHQYLVLAWAVSQRDLELLIKLVGQLCSSAAAEGGTTIVVLTQREKLEMEELFRWGMCVCHVCRCG